MKKNLFLRLLCGALCLTVALSLASCLFGEGKDTSENTQDPATEEETLPPVTDAEISFPKSGMDRFKVVYADGSSEAVVESANTLAKLIGTVCDHEPIVTNDFLREGSSTFREYEYEILVGETNREESEAFIASIRQDDLAYGCIGTKILIGARDDHNLMQAVDKFTVDIVMGKKSDEMFFRSEWAKVVKSKYNVESLTLNGAEISAYRIVYPVKNTAFEEALAGKLQLAIADETGYILPIVTDKTPNKDGRPEILIGITSRTTAAEGLVARNGYLSGNGSSVYLYGSTAAGNAEAVKAFLATVKNGTRDGVCAVELGAAQVFAPDDSTVTSMSFNVLTADVTSARTERVIATILRALPDTLGVQEANPNWMTTLNARLGKYYGCVGTGTQSATKGNEHCAIFYNKERFELIESKTYWLTDTPTENSELPGSEWPRIYTYAILRDKTTGERLMHLNTHLDTAGSEIRQTEVKLLLKFLEDYNDIPVVLSGDLNALPNTPEMQLFKDKGLIPPADALEGDFPPTFAYNPVTIDYVLSTTDCLEVLDYVVDNQRIFGDYASDHFAILIAYRFRDVEKINHGWGDAGADYPDEWLDVEKPAAPEEDLGEFHPIP